MLSFDVNQPPPSRQELEAEKLLLIAKKKQLIKHSIVSDSVHGTALLGLYWADLLNGSGLLTVIGLSTLIAVVLATTLKKQVRTADLLTVAFIAIAVAFAIAGIVHGLPVGSTVGSILSGLIAGSIVFASSLIGRQMLLVFNGLEKLKSLAESEAAEQEMMLLCRENPPLEEYRQQALLILRPNLTFGELESMRESLKQ